MAIKDENDLIANGIVSVKLISESRSSILLIQLKNGELLRHNMPNNFNHDELDDLVEKILDRRRRKQKILKLKSKINV